MVVCVYRITLIVYAIQPRLFDERLRAIPLILYQINVPVIEA
jgi:hypothetical protein